MGRLMHGDEAVAYRAVIATTYPADSESSDESDWKEQTFTQYAGPYGTTGPARAAISQAKRRATWRGSWGRPTPVVSGYVERSSITWERIDE